MLAYVFRLGWEVCELFPAVKRPLIRSWYQLVSRLDRTGAIRALNFGYAGLEGNGDIVSLEKDDLRDCYQFQLYHRLASNISLAGQDVLEVGSGRGGGASFLTRYHHPHTYTGVDLSSLAIAFCQKNYSTQGLTFVCGDAEALTFPDKSFNVVLNIESSSHYPHFIRFLAQVQRVLRPGGYFLWADIRTHEEMIAVRRDFAGAGFEIVRAELITPNVVRALELDDARKLEIMRMYAPPVMYSAFREFAGMEGSRMSSKFKAGVFEYWCIALRRAGEITNG